MNLVSKTPIKRYHIKQKCREVEKVITQCHLHSNDICRIMTTVFMDYFGNDIETDEPVCWFNQGRYRCSMTILFTSIFVTYYKKNTSPGAPLKKSIKSLTLANFIFKHANPIGLILLEKTMFELS